MGPTTNCDINYFLVTWYGYKLYGDESLIHSFTVLEKPKHELVTDIDIIYSYARIKISVKGVTDAGAGNETATDFFITEQNSK